MQPVPVAVDSLPSAGAWLFGLCCPLCVRPFAFPCDISWIWGRVAALRWWAWLPAASSAGFSCLLLCALVCAQDTARRHPAPTLCTSFCIFDVLEGRLGMPTLFRVLFSGGSPSLAQSLLCSSRLRRWRQRYQTSPYAVEAAVRVQPRAQRVNGCLGGTQNARSRCCSGCVQRAVAHGFCCYCCMLRYCCVRGVLDALLSVSLRPNKFLCLLGAFAGSPRALQECAWASGVQFVF